ncbi:MAG: hypothetical protein JNJ88_14305 [Planctomycetes bacterium]|nr:hypothetical protein [Planctomycetota bacterium]
MKPLHRRFLLAAFSVLLALAVPAVACRSTVPNKEARETVFPSVTGTALDGREVRIPEDFAGKPVLLLIGYEMETQFDLDRWLIGLLQSKTPIQFIEVPTIPGLVPGLFSGKIDDGMRSGIPKEDWGGVVTVYGGDASKIVELTGNERDRNGRICLLDGKGRVVWFHDRGFSASKLMELDSFVREKM